MTTPVLIIAVEVPNVGVAPAIQTVDLNPATTPSPVTIVTTPGPPGPPGPPGQGFPVIGEVPTGTRDGVNTSFATTVPYQPGTIAVYLNGLRELHFGENLAANAVVFEDAPLPADLITVDYTKG